MRYRRALLVAELGADTRAALSAVRGLAPDAESLVVVVSPRPSFAPRSGADAPGTDRFVDAWLEGVRHVASTSATRVEVGLVPDLDVDALEEVVNRSDTELVVAGPRPLASIPVLSELRKRRHVAVVWVAPSVAPRSDAPMKELFCLAVGARAEAALAGFLRDHGDAAMHVTAFSLARPSPGELAATLAVSGVRASVELIGRSGLPPWRNVGELARERALDLVVLAHFPGLLLRTAVGPAPILVLPPASPRRAALQRPLDVPDLVDDGAVIRVRLGHAFGFGRNPPIADQEVAFVSGGRVFAVVTTRAGEAELPSGSTAESVGLFRARDAGASDPLAAVERRVAVVRPGARSLVLFDAEVQDAELSALTEARGVELLAVRLRPMRSCHLVRERLRSAGLAPRVIDASAVLDEGNAEDVNDALDGVRLARVATRMLAAGFRIAAIVPRGPHTPAAIGFGVLRAQEVAGGAREPPVQAPRQPSLDARLDATTGAASIAGNRVEVELDNPTARRWLLETIAHARDRLHCQTYMAADDDVGRRVEHALRGAARRGVAVRVLVDSLHALHGSFGMRNPLLERLSSCAGIEVRASRPVAGVPSLEDLKQRDHRKLVVADGRVALLGGRNLAREYFTGFDEVKLTPTTPWRDVPWLDAGVRVEGPAVAELDRSFREAWTAAGGARFDVRAPPAVGRSAARVVIHRGLRDASTLEAYLALIETARSHVYAVTGFPLLLELQHALLRALRRGVRVRTLFGHVTPTHGGEPFEGPGSTARLAATAFVHSRMDALVAAGGEAYLLAVRGMPGWTPELGVVHPHVHAKALSADGRVCAVGSANLDVTASYWESELLLLVEDDLVARAFEASVDALMAGSVRLNRDDPAWQRLARRREWFRHWPGVLSI